MATLDDFTTCSQVRAALGVSVDELPDETIMEPMYLTQLLEEFHVMSPNLLAQLEAAKLLTTDQAVRLTRVASLYSTLQVAYFLRGALHNFAPKAISDGKASVQRFIDPIKDVIDALRADLSAARVRMLDANAAFLGSTTSAAPNRVPGLIGARNNYDPVTG